MNGEKNAYILQIKLLTHKKTNHETCELKTERHAVKKRLNCPGKCTGLLLNRIQFFFTPLVLTDILDFVFQFYPNEYVWTVSHHRSYVITPSL